MKKMLHITMLSISFSFPSILANGQFVVSDPQTTLAIIESKITTLAQLQQNYNLTKSWIEGLVKINTKIENYRRIAETIDLTIKTIEVYNQTKKDLSYSSELDPGEWADLSLGFTKILSDNKQLIQDLYLATRPGLSMSDKERYDMIQDIHTKISSHYASVSFFAQQIRLVIQNRKEETFLRKNLL